QWREIVDRAGALDSLNLAAVGLCREHQAGAGAVSVEQHGAGAAHTMLAADMGAGEAERMAQEVAEQQPRLDLAPVADAINGDGDRSRCGHAVPPCVLRDGASRLLRMTSSFKA